MILRLSHVCLNVNNLAKSIEFYKNIGCCVKFKFKRKSAEFGAYLELVPGSFIEIFETKHSCMNNPGGIAHFCLETGNIDDFIEHCVRNRIAVSPKKLGCDNTWQVWLKDPDGNNFEVHQYTENSSQRTGESVEADW
jgi:lactoylglutathione lyase/glyoxylase I family protein